VPGPGELRRGVLLVRAHMAPGAVTALGVGGRGAEGEGGDEKEAAEIQPRVMRELLGIGKSKAHAEVAHAFCTLKSKMKPTLCGTRMSD
jgi:hypothetical protein